MNASDVLRGALDRLTDPERWWKGEGGPVGDGCAMTAMSQFVCTNTDLDELLLTEDHEHFEALRSAWWFLKAEIDYREIPDWNDDPHTSFEDLRLAFKRALARAEEDES